ncbi:UDP-galactopyranose mutase [Mangrovicella endophytica]|uniref:UDP-galactopyranose mutase n=1 Tax=Mangrovicella endophytica TaxID=2066697 RepID=UPI000C9DB513|nr:UDP-galactopyranose mutase [Mangrovicella endophytica]
MFDWLVVGAGFAGSVIAERLASQLDAKVLVIDRRPHIGGNAYDRLDDAGILIHQYGPHIFHTNSDAVFDYLSQFTRWRPYEHRVLAEVDGQRVPIPINRTTINRLYGLSLSTDAEAEAFFAARAEPIEKIKTSEDVVVASVGRELYEKFFRGYTRKQWGVDPSDLDKSVTARVPTRTNTDDRYFSDTHQAMPADGYTRMFERMLDHPNITVRTGIDFDQIRDIVTYQRLIFTGPIDEYFRYVYGRLPYRSLSFKHVTLDTEWHQSVAVVNYPQTQDYTRVTEYKHLTGQSNSRTSLTYEYPTADGDPYYPIPREENQAIFRKYQALARSHPDVHFIGRLATYRYYNMDQVVGQALATFKRIREEHAEHRTGRRLPDPHLQAEEVVQP